MRSSRVVIRHPLTAVIIELGFQRQAIAAYRPGGLFIIEGGLTDRIRIVDEVRHAIVVIVVVQVHPTVAVSIFRPGGVVGLNVLDQEDIVVVVVVNPRVVLDHDIGVRDHVTGGVLGDIDADQMAVVLVPVEVSAWATDGIDGVFIQVGIRIGPRNVALAARYFSEEAKRRIAIKGRRGQQITIVERTRQQRLTIGLVVGQNLIEIAAIHIVNEQSGHVALSVIRRQLGDLDRRATVGTLEVR